MNTTGRLITFEGCDGVGKTTAVNIAEEYLILRGVKYLRTAEPSGTELGKNIRQYVTELSVDHVTSLMLLAAARKHHMEVVIKPAIAEGYTVICDRFVDSSYAYQVAGFGVDAGVCETLQDIALGDVVPDLTILVVAPVDVSLGRLADRKHVEAIEKLNVNFHKAVRDGFLSRAITNSWETAIVESHFGFGVSETESLLRFKQALISTLFNENIE